jgi:hypothetical protein
MHEKTKKETKIYKPVMVSNDFYDKLENIRASLGERTLIKAFEVIADFYIANEKTNKLNDKDM